MARIRTFIAFAVPGRIAGEIVDLQRELAVDHEGVKWMMEKELHLTLLFLGEVDELDLVSVCRAVKKIAAKHPSFALDVTGMGGFPNKRRPKVLWAGIGGEGIDNLLALHKELEAALMEIGCYRREERAYTPHLTLGRISTEERDEAWGPVFTKHADWNAGTFSVNEVLVMGSELRRSGPEYSVIGRGALASATNDE
ncbi:RNA 2',3'-cyclic phosphodiesterase [Zavarzinella formosa]|uniref:RNA 2',3'-cyclic phosphodiesterase n=1 Tax=Zavarzinella formosa TaxID=360055 RepID=UPI0002FDCBB6|nr:RNA 2',3'-cyclic phosphodiesterase [Zavarzinella formosa]